MKGKLIKKDDSWLVEYKEDFCDGVAVHFDYWTFSVPVRYIDVRNLIFKDIIKEGDIVDFEFIKNKDNSFPFHHYAKILLF